MLNRFRSQKIIWDKASRVTRETIEAHAGDVDGRKLTVHVVDDGEIVDLTGSVLSLVWATKDNEFAGEDVFDDTGIAIGEFELVYTAEMLSHAGKILKASLRLVMDEEVIESKGLSISVMKSNYVESAEQSGEFSQLQLALIRLADIESDESGRKAAELLREANEADRKAAETARKSAETARKTAETARESAETARGTAYTAAENARDGQYSTAENARDTAYGQAESARDGQYATAENARNSTFNTAENTRNAAELVRIANEGDREDFFDLLQRMLADGDLNGKDLDFNWSGTKLGVRLKGDTNYVYVDLKGDPGQIENLTTQHIATALGFTPLKYTQGTNVQISEAGKISATDTKTTINGKTGAITKADIAELGIPVQDTVYDDTDVQQALAGLSDRLDNVKANDLAARREILDIKLKLDEMQIVDYLNKTGIGFYDLFTSLDHVDTTKTTASVNIGENHVVFSGNKELAMLPQVFDSPSGVELSIYDKDREKVDVTASSSAKSVKILAEPGAVSIGDRFAYGDKIFTVANVS